MVGKSVTVLDKLGDVLRKKPSMGPAGKDVVVVIEKEMIDKPSSCGGGLNCRCQFDIKVSGLSIEPSIPLMVPSSACLWIFTTASAAQ